MMYHGIDCRKTTFPLKCRYCGNNIFFHSCSCGSRVLLDNLGPPWSKHDCRTQNRPTAPYAPSGVNTPSGVNVFRASPNSTGLLPQWRHSAEYLDPAMTKRVTDSRYQYRNTQRIDPLGSTDAEFVGLVLERLRPDLARRYRLPRNSIGFIHLANIISAADPVQLTVQVDELSLDPAAIDFSGYTFLLPPNLDAPGIDRGALVCARLTPVEAMDGTRLWLAQEIELLH